MCNRVCLGLCKIFYLQWVRSCRWISWHHVYCWVWQAQVCPDAIRGCDWKKWQNWSDHWAAARVGSWTELLWSAWEILKENYWTLSFCCEMGVCVCVSSYEITRIPSFREQHTAALNTEMLNINFSVVHLSVENWLWLIEYLPVWFWFQPWKRWYQSQIQHSLTRQEGLWGQNSVQNVHLAPERKQILLQPFNLREVCIHKKAMSSVCWRRLKSSVTSSLSEWTSKMLGAKKQHNKMKWK